MRFWLRHVLDKIRSPRGFNISLDYPVRAAPRYGYGKPVHPLLRQIIDARRHACRSLLEACLSFKAEIWRMESGQLAPVWANPFLTPLDGLVLYTLIRLHRPRLYLEIGSGHSTRFARRAILDGNLTTTVDSIDAHSRIEIREIADRVIEQPMEEVSLDLFDSLRSGDILFVDGSHRVFTNSDATVVFLDILPRLKPGVLVQFHDIFLPADYPPEWNARYYSEQYLLACHLLAQPHSVDILFASAFVSDDPELRSTLGEIWSHPSMKGLEKHGCSFWLRM